MATLVEKVLQPSIAAEKFASNTANAAAELASETASVPPEIAKALAQIVVDTIINSREFWANVGKRGVKFIEKYDSPTELSGQAAVDLIRALELLDKEDAEAIADLKERYAEDSVFKAQVDASRAAIKGKANEYAAKSNGAISYDEVIDAGVVTVVYLYFVVRDLLENASRNRDKAYEFIKRMLPHIKRKQFEGIIESAQGAFNSTKNPEEKQEYIVNICKGLVVLNKPSY